MEPNDFLKREYGLSPNLLELASECEADVSARFRHIDDVDAACSCKVLSAFRRNRVAAGHFAWETGYGYDDAGREVTERVFADAFGAEAALVRMQIVNGTHALALTLTGLLMPGDELVYCTGAPYDTLHSVIGIGGQGRGQGSLAEYGVGYRQVELLPSGGIDYDALAAAVTPATRMACLQRATGYADRRALTMPEIAEWADFLRTSNPDIIRMVDNCYGEFLDIVEPTAVGADVMAGSLIKNPGGGLALSGGYVAGRADLVERVSYRLTCAGIGGECGLTFGQTRQVLQGLFLSPHVTAGALKGAVFCARLFARLGCKVSPAWDADRSDIIETVTLGSAEALRAFCEGVQAAAPVDSHVRPEPWDMPGYKDPVIMAAGAFVQGSSIELSADGPMREPYNAYFQGGLTYEYSKLGALMAAQKLIERGLMQR
jgi:cystathionine beta-lyase family protein involved in aluminum resistance